MTCLNTFAVTLAIMRTSHHEIRSDFSKVMSIFFVVLGGSFRPSDGKSVEESSAMGAVAQLNFIARYIVTQDLLLL